MRLLDLTRSLDSAGNGHRIQARFDLDLGHGIVARGLAAVRLATGERRIWSRRSHHIPTLELDDAAVARVLALVDDALADAERRAA